jgi:hypothetical protein
LKQPAIAGNGKSSVMPKDRRGHRKLLLSTPASRRLSSLTAIEGCDDLLMKFLQLVISGALLLPLAAWSPAASGQNMSSSEVRNMTAADFQRHIDEEGAQQFVRRLVKDIDPHSPEEPNYDIVLEHVAEGSNGWLKAAAEIGPYTDTTFSQGIRVAIADALVVNPVGVLKMIGTEEHFDEACGYPFVRQTEKYMEQHKREALSALGRVHQPSLAGKKESCRKKLMDMPTTTASDTGHSPSGMLN